MGGFGLPWQVFALEDNPPDQAVASSTSVPYRPPQWNKSQITFLTVAGLGDNGATENYYFDAVLRVEHDQELRYTLHPVQTGAPISDHAYLMPARVILEIGMSDAMARFDPGAYTGSGSKSVSAYQKFKEIQALRQPITLSTRLDTYENMLIERILAPDSNATQYSLKSQIIFAQIRPAVVSTTLFQNTSEPSNDPSQSARPQQSVDTPGGSQTPTQPANFFNLLDRFENLSTTNVPGAGTLSSNINPVPSHGGQ
jgi:hypothetical protein